MLLRVFLLQTFLVIGDSFFMGPLKQVVSNFRFDPPSNRSQPPTTVSVGSIIQCMADGRPTPIIKWYDTYGDLVSASSGLNVTENMRHWRQPVTLHCLAFNDIWFPRVKGIYTFQVGGALSSGGDVAGEISFYPPSIVGHPTTVSIGDIIQCKANGISSPTIKWYDYRWNEVSGWSGLNVTEEMQYWRQPISFHCRAHNDLIFPGIEGRYTLQVAGAPSSEGDEVKLTGTQFSPSSSSKGVEVGTDIRAIRTILYKSSSKVSKQIQPAIRWYDTKWNELSAWGGLVVTEEMRHWEQPIILHYRVYNGLDYAASEDNYQFEVAGAISSGQVAVSWISFNPPSRAEAPATLAVGTIVQCMVNGSTSSTPKWYDANLNVVSRSSQLPVTEDMRLSKQPITLKCKADWSSVVESSYTFRVLYKSSDGQSSGDQPFDDQTSAVVNRPVVNRPVVNRPVVNRPVVNRPVVNPPRTLLDLAAVPRVSFYPPSRAYAPTTLTVGTSIDCIANGMTSPTIKWYDSNWNTVSWSSSVYVTEHMRHWKQPITLRCKAQNGSWPSREVQDFYTFQVAYASSGTEAWVIAVAVIVPIVGLTAIAIAIFFIIRRREKKKMSTAKNKPTNGSTAALLFQY